MPSIATHYAVAKIVGNTLNIENDDYFLGNILPDIINNDKSHFKAKGSYYLIPDIGLYIKTNKHEKYVFLGYLTHLLLDKYFLEEYIPNNIKEYNKIDLFSTNIIYNEYTYINRVLVNKYKLDIEYISNIIKTSKYDLNKEKVNKNLYYINSNIKEKNKYINVNDYIEFIESISIRISNEIKRWC